MVNKNNDRAILFAKYLIQNNSTIRQTAKVFGYSKSTVHNDLKNKLKKVDYVLYEQIKIILKNNFLEKHLRGGLATKQKYLKIKK